MLEHCLLGAFLISSVEGLNDFAMSNQSIVRFMLLQKIQKACVHQIQNI